MRDDYDEDDKYLNSLSLSLWKKLVLEIYRITPVHLNNRLAIYMYNKKRKLERINFCIIELYPIVFEKKELLQYELICKKYII